jgi:putative endonuclease
VRTAAQRVGQAAEASAARHLRGLGWPILGRNVRVGRAEIDLLAIDPDGSRALVVVEVRWRSRRDFGLPEETIDRPKVARLRAAGHAVRAAGSLATGIPVPPLPLRIDLVVLEPDHAIRHHRNVS